MQPLAENSLYKRLVIFSPLYISYYYRVKKQRLRKTAIWAYVRRGRVVIECSRAAEAAYYIELFFDLCLLGGEFTHCSTAIAGACYQCLALRVLSARLKHVIVSWWTSFSVWQLLVSCKRLNENGRRIVVCWLGSSVCLQWKDVWYLLQLLGWVDCFIAFILLLTHSEIPGWSCQ